MHLYKDLYEAKFIMLDWPFSYFSSNISDEKKKNELVSWEIHILKAFQDYEKEAKSYELKNNLQAFSVYGKLVDEFLPLYTTAPDPYAQVRKIQNEAYNKILSKGEELQKQQRYEDALTIYKCAPLAFASEIKKLSKQKNEMLNKNS